MIVHTILGLPGESPDDILKTISYLDQMDIQGHQTPASSCTCEAQILPEIMKQGFSGHMSGRNTWILSIDCLEHFTAGYCYSPA